MKIEKIEYLRSQKQGIIEDLRVCISYTPNRDNDLLCFMEQYLKADIKKRPSLLKEIKRCINGDEYENPFLNYYYYNEKDIRKLALILDDFIDNIKNLKNINNDIDREIEEIIIETICKINELHDKCLGELIDSWRDEKLTDLINIACKYRGYENAIDIIQTKKLW